MIRPNIGIDTSVLVRLVTGQPPDLFALCVERLSALSGRGRRDIRVQSGDWRGLRRPATPLWRLEGGRPRRDSHHPYQRPGRPLNGRAVLDALAASGGPGLFDRLIANDYARAGMDTLTLDRRMASLPQARLVSD